MENLVTKIFLSKIQLRFVYENENFFFKTRRERKPIQ